MKSLACFCVSITGLFLMASIGFGGEITIKTSGSGSVDAVLTYTIENKEVTITGCNKDVAGDLVIPQNIEGLPVASIDGAFYKCKKLISVVISAKIKTLGRATFAECDLLKEVLLPSSLEETGESCFAWAPFSSIILPENLSTINKGSFSRTQLSRITIPKAVRKIGSYTFLFCGKLKNVAFEGRAPEVADDAFWHEDELRNQRKIYALVQPEHAESFGGVGADWKGLIVTLDKEKRGGQSEARLSMKGPSKPQAPMRPRGVGLTETGELAATGNEYLDGLLERTKLEWAGKRGSAIAEIDKKFIDKLKETKLSLIRANKISEARAYDNAIKGRDLSEQEPSSLVSLRKARAELIEKTTLPFNREYWKKLKEIREAFQENGNLKGIDVVDGEINRLIEDYSKAPEEVEKKTSLFDKPREDKVESVSLTNLQPFEQSKTDDASLKGSLVVFDKESPYGGKVNRGNYSNPSINGFKVVDFIYANPPSSHSCKIPKGMNAFTVICSKMSGTSPTLKFIVKIDGKVFFESASIGSYKEDYVPVLIDIPKGSKELTLVVDEMGDFNNDHAVWLKPMFRAEKPTEEQVLSLK